MELFGEQRKDKRRKTLPAAENGCVDTQESNGINRGQLRILILQKFATLAAFARACGFREDFIKRLLNGHSTNTDTSVNRAATMAAVLGTTVDSLLEFPTNRRGSPLRNQQPRGSDSASFPWTMTTLDIVGDDFLGSIHDRLTYTRCAHTYYMPDPMAHWYMTTTYREKLGWSESRIAKHLEIAGWRWSWDRNQQSSYSHRRRHLMRASVLREAHAKDRNWIAEVRSNITATSEQVALFLASEEAWNHIDGHMADIGYENYCCIDVFDTMLAIVVPMCGGTQYVIRDPNQVLSIRAIIEWGLREVGRSNPRYITDAMLDRKSVR